MFTTALAVHEVGRHVNVKCALTFALIDQEDLERADVVLTTYDVVANEWAARGGAVDDKPSAKKAKAPKALDDDSDSDGFGGDLKKRKEALLAATKGSKSKKTVKPQDALFQVNFLRVVVDEVRFPVHLQERSYQTYSGAKYQRAENKAVIGMLRS